MTILGALLFLLSVYKWKLGEINKRAKGRFIYKEEFLKVWKPKLSRSLPRTHLLPVSPLASCPMCPQTAEAMWNIHRWWYVVYFANTCWWRSVLMWKIVGEGFVRCDCQILWKSLYIYYNNTGFTKWCFCGSFFICSYTPIIKINCGVYLILFVGRK